MLEIEQYFIKILEIEKCLIKIMDKDVVIM
jgi:hypothetical protein